MRIETGHQFPLFSEDNAYTSDPVLPALLKRTLPAEILREVELDLERLGHDVVTSIRTLGDSAKVFEPTLVQYDQWGRRVDDLQTSEGWRELKALSQREGLPAIFYERKQKEFSRVYGFAKAHLMVGDTHTIFCPISMTDGSARVIELQGTEEMKKDIFPRLISRDPAIAFTAGQWMTERPGGSDVSLTETIATPSSAHSKYGKAYNLNGFKWFSSATDSNISVALARTGTLEQGSRGLSLFLIPLRRPLFPSAVEAPPSSTSNNIFVHRLKKKVGTKIVPTAELSLENTEGYLIGQQGQGVKSITPVLNITRLWSAIDSVGNLRKALAIAASYARVRSIKSGTTLLSETPLHLEQLASVNVVYRALVHLTFHVIGLLGKVECGVATEEDAGRLRLLTPVVKAYTAEKSCTAIEEAMAAMGGAGYMEENGFGRSIRDALVEKIWEGTVVVLSLDVARAAQDPKTMQAFVLWSNNVVNTCPPALATTLAPQLDLVRQAVSEYSTCYKPPMAPLVPRPAIILAGALTSSITLLEQAMWSTAQKEPSAPADVEVFRRWVTEGDLASSLDAVRRANQAGQGRIGLNVQLVYGSESGNVKGKL